MPSGPFQKGDDPRRHLLTEEETAHGMFKPGNTGHLEHGLLLPRPREVIPPEHWASLPKHATLDMIAGELLTLMQMAGQVHHVIAIAADTESLEFVGPYAQLVSKIDATLTDIQGGKLRGGSWPDLDAQGIEASKYVLSQTAAQSLTKIQFAWEWAKEHGVYAAPKVKRGKRTKKALQETPRRFFLLRFASAIAGCRVTLERWARLLLYEEKLAGKKQKSAYLEARAQVTQRR